MTKTYAQIVKQIEVLKQDAERARRKEVDGVIGRIRDAISVYDLSAEDLGFGTAGAGKPGDKASGKTTAAAPVPRKTRGPAKTFKADKAPPAVKFANGNGGTWGGLGKRPQWLRDALNEGKTLADFAVK